MSGRTKPMADAIMWDEVSGKAVLIDYQPGDMTRYLCRIEHLNISPRALMSLGFGGDEPNGCQFLFAWLNRAPGGACCVLRNAGFLPAGYLAEKLGVNMVTAAVLAELIAHYTNRTAESTALDVPGETAPRVCPTCGGVGVLLQHNDPGYPSRLCVDCDGEGVQRLSP